MSIALTHTHTDTAQWTYPTLTNGSTSATAFGGGRVRYKKEGNRVIIAGGLDSIQYQGSGLTIFTLPVGYRPANENHYFFRPTGGKNIARVYVDDAGGVILEWIVQISNGANYTTATWLDMNMEFTTD